MKLIIYRGVPGSSKTTKAIKMLETLPPKSGHFEADMFFMKNGEYKWEPSKVKDAHQWCRAHVESYLIQNTDVIVSNTFTQLWEVQPYLDMAKKYGAEVVIYRTTKQYGNVHNVPDEIIEKMKARMEDIPGEILVE